MNIEIAEHNVLKLENPHEYSCTVWMYRVHHPVLVIRISKENQPQFWLFFENAVFFDGPMNWKGAEFHIASQDEKRKLLGYLGHKPDVLRRYGMSDETIERLYSYHKLYVVRAQMEWLEKDHNLVIRILAGKYSISYKDYKIGDFFA